MLTENRSKPVLLPEQRRADLFGHGLSEEEWKQGTFTTTYKETVEDPINNFPNLDDSPSQTKKKVFYIFVSDFDHAEF